MNPIAKRIDLNKFIKTLVNAYNTGADYIDLEFILDDPQSSPFVRIHIKDEYMIENSERKEELYEHVEPDEIDDDHENEEFFNPKDEEDDDDLLSEDEIDKLA